MTQPYSIVSSTSALSIRILSSRYTNSFVWLYIWPAASTLNVAVDSGIPFARKHMISALASDTMRPNAAHTTTIPPTIFLRCLGDCETTPAWSAESMPQSGVARTHSPAIAPPRRPAPLFFLRCTKASMMPLSALKRVEATFITAAKEMLRRRGASTYP